MKPKVLQIRPGRWYCISDYKVLSFGTWQEALREANRAAWKESVISAMQESYAIPREWANSTEKESNLTRQLPDNFHVV